MHTFQKTISLDSDIESVYRLISDIQKYHEFIPWCSASKIISREVIERNEKSDAVILEKLVADLNIGFGFITQKYYSLVLLSPPRVIEEDQHRMVKYNVASVIAEVLESATIQFLKTSWKLKQVSENNTEVDFHIEIELSSKTFSVMLSKLFPGLCDKMVEAFSKRLF